ncbi:hypothetical protein EZS27_026784 [termite gut metagenome]|uniref:Uncharacterized protein n=1 Tax=termite gut metagenome TaxID=433724 RepID=A0A5J4QS64_9ZZZZ
MVGGAPAEGRFFLPRSYGVCAQVSRSVRLGLTECEPRAYEA